MKVDIVVTVSYTYLFFQQYLLHTWSQKFFSHVTLLNTNCRTGNENTPNCIMQKRNKNNRRRLYFLINNKSDFIFFFMTSSNTNNIYNVSNSIVVKDYNAPSFYLIYLHLDWLLFWLVFIKLLFLSILSRCRSTAKVYKVMKMPPCSWYCTARYLIMSHWIRSVLICDEMIVRCH